ncbi:unnamed protein product [Camellia sinensis]
MQSSIDLSVGLYCSDDGGGSSGAEVADEERSGGPGDLRSRDDSAEKTMADRRLGFILEMKKMKRRETTTDRRIGFPLLLPTSSSPSPTATLATTLTAVKSTLATMVIAVVVGRRRGKRRNEGLGERWR